MWAFVFMVVALAYLALLLWYRWAWQQLPEVEAPPEGWQPSTAVTVIVPARNESLNIDACINSITAQRYPQHLLQVLVMDDASEDDTAPKVATWSSRFPFVRCISLDADSRTQAHKKRAIEKGIAKACGELMVCTDADCTHDANWLRALVYRYEVGGVQFIAGPVLYETKASLLSVFQTLDFMTLQGITGASVGQRFHTMCNGANIAYTKKAFLEVGGFAGIDQLPTGDDMLLMYKIFKRYPEGVVWLKSKAAVVRTKPCSTWNEFFQQRIRWASKAAYYDDRRMFWVLLLVYVFNAMILTSLVVSFWWQQMLVPTIGVIVFKTIGEWYFLVPVASFFGQRKWLHWFPWLQLHHMVYTIIAGWLGRFGQYQWKGRLVANKKAG